MPKWSLWQLVRMANIINNTIADTETGTLLTGEWYHTDITTQFYNVAETLRLILYDTLPQWFYSIQCNLVNELTTCQGQGHSTIDNYIWGLQESFAYTNQFPSIPRVKPMKPPKNKKEEIVLMCSSPPPPNNKSTTTLSSNESMVSASKNPNIQLSKEVDNLITFLKQFKAPSNVTHFLLSAGYHTISRNGENSSRYWNWIVKRLLESKQNSETVRRGFKIPLYARGPLYEP